MNLPVPKNDRSQQSLAVINSFTERFANVSNLADPGDRLMMLEKLKGELETFRTEEQKANADKKMPASTLIITMLGGAAVAGVAGALLFGPPGILLCLVGEGLTGMGMVARSRAIDRKLEGSQTSYGQAGALLNHIDALRTDMLDNTDINAFIDSPRATDVFTKFPALKEKFMVAATVEKMRESRNLPKIGIDKPSGHSGGVEL